MKAKLRSLLVAGAVSIMLSQPSVAADVEVDPWEGFNRAMFSFNDGLDTYALKPVSQGYKAIMPDIAETGVSNFFGNLSDVGTLLNNLLQGKFSNATQDFARIAFNSTFGLAGLIDVATPMGIEKHDEDFGQTFGYWGVESGPYLVLPFFGPTTVRDGIGRVPDYLVDPVRQLDDNGARNAMYATRIINDRAELLEAEKLISGDKYTFVRDAYLQKRAFSIVDGDGENYDESNF
ncbi:MULTISPECIES: VacJ family lipoprotein [unclassified Neptuniibacter]|uniref:MlaA family lipoprotein n=1 Tax=unclassified Neptuniibacter TaxID=2630693 RepID=UPI0026E32AC8|nr:MULTISPECIES: VacJ family lipoprotein [unclassified Neptuniibacter]MDO6513684.1 VacJ family lipoprotein [Neptuniibacter sp. 2_MG-2023]MDO6593825.1 VacJ family lipoprotein [Neptuniibacter sp. 1_MG-2023]